jgi:hypothetical protein
MPGILLSVQLVVTCKQETTTVLLLSLSMLCPVLSPRARSGTWLLVEIAIGLLSSSTALLLPSLGPEILILGLLVHLSGWVTMFASVFEDNHFIRWRVTSSPEISFATRGRFYGGKRQLVLVD